MIEAPQGHTAALHYTFTRVTDNTIAKKNANRNSTAYVASTGNGDGLVHFSTAEESPGPYFPTQDN